MRAGGARVGVGEVLYAHRALAVVPPDAAREALRAALCSSRREVELFDWAWSELVSAAPLDQPLAELLESARAALPRVAVPADRAGRIPVGPADAELEELPAAWSGEELLLHKDFALYTEAERAAARALLARLATRGPTRRSRRMVRARRGPMNDMRRTLRASMRHGGEPFERHWRA